MLNLNRWRLLVLLSCCWLPGTSWADGPYEAARGYDSQDHDSQDHDSQDHDSQDHDSQDLDPQSLLPPELPWSGASEGLLAGAEDPWITPAERSQLTETPSYDETFAWVRALVAATPELSLTSIGKSHEGREIWMVVASATARTGANAGASARNTVTPEALARDGKPILFAHGGIHAGEIDGKDAGLMVLRDLRPGGRLHGLLDKAHFLFVPILNVDGHERSGPFNRANQRGPKVMGWRTNARNQNLNRDFAKLDTPEVRALVAALGRWHPDLYLDLHVTDGADYQYDITYGFTGRHGHSPAGAAWLEEVLSPRLDRDLKAQGHIPGPLIFLVNDSDPAQGNQDWTASPRFSNGYGDARQLPTVLVENHSLKPYRQRVLGTYVLLESCLRTLGEEGAALRRAVAADRARRPASVALTFRQPAAAPVVFDFLGIASRREPSAVTGAERLIWTGEPVTVKVPQLATTEPEIVASRPAAYWISPTWPEVIERLRLHGIRLEEQTAAREVAVELLRLEDPQLAQEPFEGRLRISAGLVAEAATVTYPAGSVRVPTDQPLGTLAVQLLEPAAPDSFFQWGFFLEVLQPTEYLEAYVGEVLAARMLAADPDLERQFQAALAADAELAANPRARLQWFYGRSPYQDRRWRLYPVGREKAAQEGERR